ncbi:YlxR family protein [Lawsonella clevelandensis]|uniref:YlxR family protein n=1 Tax=Lawsonella clevelandensis TaxID=1528099 RepID=UPI0009E7F91F|nr:YlxR family protein [Lawsonella clevelandensis]
MCIVTRERRECSTLWRFVSRRTADGTELVFDPRAVLPGRGAWILPDQQVYELALQRHAFHRALRVQGLLNTDTATQAVSAWCSTPDGNVHSVE